MSSTPESAPLTGMDEPTGRPGDPDWYTRRVELGLYVLAGVSYIVLGVFHKWLLNWIIGPVWLVTWIWVVPIVVDRLRGGRGDTP